MHILHRFFHRNDPLILIRKYPFVHISYQISNFWGILFPIPVKLSSNFFTFSQSCGNYEKDAGVYFNSCISSVKLLRPKSILWHRHSNSYRLYCPLNIHNRLGNRSWHRCRRKASAAAYIRLRPVFRPQR